MLGDEKKAYLVHPKEWMLWLLIFGVVASFRVLRYSYVSVFAETKQNSQHFDGLYTSSAVLQRLNSVCFVEANFLCDVREIPPWLESPCLKVWDFPLAPVLHFVMDYPPLPRLSARESLNCSIVEHPTYFASSNVSTLALFDREENEVAIVMSSVFKNMIPHLSRITNGLSIVNLFIQRFYCMFTYKEMESGSNISLAPGRGRFDSNISPRPGRWKLPGHPPSWENIILSDPSLWTEEVFFALLMKAKEQTAAGLRKTFKNELQYQQDILHNNRDQNPTAMIEEEVQHISGRDLIELSGSRRDRMHEMGLAFRILTYIDHGEKILKNRLKDDSSDNVCMSHLDPSEMPETRKKSSHLLFRSQQLNECVYSHYFAQESVLSDSCREAMDEAPAKLDEIEFEDHGGFLMVSRIIFLGVNFVACFVLLNLGTARRRFEKQLDRSRNKLEQELNDPFLRQSLEHKARSLPEEDRDKLISRLEAKLVAWDSKDGALKILRRHIRRFRLMLLFTVTLTTISYGFLHFFQVSSMPRYLETIAMSFAMLSATYWIQIDDCDSKSTGAEIAMGDLEASATKALLSADEHDGCGR